jgi:hypothetical protein
MGKKTLYVRRPGTNNSSGLAGIRYEVRERHRVDRCPWVQEVYIATWPGGGRRQFSLNKHGEDGALELARRCRAEELAKLGLVDNFDA